MKDFYAFINKVEDTYKTTNSVLRLSKKNKEICRFIAESIASKENKENWDISIAKYLNNPNIEGSDPRIYDEVLNLATEHNIGIRLASILNNARIADAS